MEENLPNINKDNIEKPISTLEKLRPWADLQMVQLYRYEQLIAKEKKDNKDVRVYINIEDR